ncbi:DUF1566 domain-containing protein [Candidatus Binatia bacterium]|nr:DUF1566 domain-containing protein [Candidatus Binatia bacterium]
MTTRILLLIAALLLPPATSRAESLLPRSGQKGCWSTAGNKVPCNGTRQDGDDTAGHKIRLIDGGNGTLTDANTRLVWEKLSRDGSVHERNALSTWDQALAKIATLNTPPCFANVCTWRLPNAKELQSIVDYDKKSPAFPAQFNKKCQPGCSVATCSCTPTVPVGSTTGFWSSTTNRSATSEAWQVLNATGAVASVAKTATGNVRAVAEPTCSKAILTVRVAYDDAAAAGAGVTTVIDYPGDLAALPGLGSAPSVTERLANLSGQSGIFSGGDQDSDADGTDDRVSIGLVLGSAGIVSGPFAQATFDCPAGDAPLVSDFACTLDASDANGDAIPGGCSVGLRYE